MKMSANSVIYLSNVPRDYSQDRRLKCLISHADVRSTRAFKILALFIHVLGGGKAGLATHFFAINLITLAETFLKGGLPQGQSVPKQIKIIVTINVADTIIYKQTKYVQNKYESMRPTVGCRITKLFIKNPFDSSERPIRRDETMATNRKIRKYIYSRFLPLSRQVPNPCGTEIEIQESGGALVSGAEEKLHLLF
ncbi:hypothetical protein C0J52_12511 [Blattella germanica]|nr:hypothetical protein C0J52_12511 [Blattella germanica]